MAEKSSLSKSRKGSAALGASQKSAKSGHGGKRPGAGRPRKTEIKNAAFEAGQRYQPGRGFIYMPTDSRKELTRGSRLEMIRKSRWLYNNFGIAARAVDAPSGYAVQGGIMPQPRTGNRDWNEMILHRFIDTVGTTPWAFDAAGQVNFFEGQKAVPRHALLDGELFAQPIRSASGAGMMRFIPSEFIGSPRGQYGMGKEEKGWSDGVQLDRMSRPRKYRVLKDPSGDEYQDVAAADLWCFSRRKRLGAARVPTALAHAVNHLHDMTEIVDATKGSFKLASQIAFVIYTDAPGGLNMGPVIPGSTAAAGETEADSPLRIDQIQQGTMIPQLKPHEKLQEFKNTHPGDSFDPMMNYLARDISWGIGLSPEVLWNIAGATGANNRFVLADAQVFFEELQQMVINQYCRPFWKFWVWGEIQADRVSYPGEDWFRCDWIPPRQPTVDFGRDSKARSELVDAGRLSESRYAAMHGMDLAAEDRHRMETIARRKQDLEDFNNTNGTNLTYEEVFSSPQKSVSVNPAPAPSPSAD
ncbi:MAG: phage portal protein [Verrucomicrobiota bacterium]